MALRVLNLESASAARTAWTGAPANYDIVANDPFKGAEPGMANPSEGRPCRRVKVNGAGNLVYTGLDGVDVTLPCLAGDTWDIQMIALKNTSTATNVVVMW
jgi:hypothetical protein